MGQRLVVSVVKNKERIAAIYYHWGAYSSSAVCTAKEIVDELERLQHEEPEKDLRLGLIRFVESQGGGIDGGKDGEEAKKVRKMFPNETFDKDAVSRNDGLIALTEECMEHMLGWAEGEIVINLDSEIVTNDVCWSYSSLEELNDMCETECTEDNCFPTEVDIADFKFDEFDEVIEAVNTCLVVHSLRSGTYYEMVC